MKFWQAMKARSEGKAVRYKDGEVTTGWVNANIAFAGDIHYFECAEWEVKQEPRRFKLLKYRDRLGYCVCTSEHEIDRLDASIAEVIEVVEVLK